MTEPELLLAHRDFVRALAAELVHDVAAVDDVEQQTLLAAWERRGDAPRSPRAWLATVARNFARQFRRDDQRRREREQAAAARERIPSVADVVEREERRRAVVAAVLALAEPFRGAVLLRFYEGLAPREIARRLAVPAETARTRVKRGVEMVRARLVAAEGAVPGEPRDLRAWLLPLAGPIVKGLPPVAKWAALAAAGLIVGTFTWVTVNGGWKSERASADGASSVAAAAATDDIESPRVEGLSAAAVEAARKEEEVAPAPVAAEAPATRPIRGRVVDARAAPIAGAAVFAWPDFLADPVRLDDERGLAKRPHATSGADGHFELAVPTDLERCTLLATAEGRSPGTKISVEAGDEPILVLEATDVLIGRVADERGEAIADAQVRSWGMHGGALIEHATTSDEHGGYRLLAPIADRAAWLGDSESWWWCVEARAAGFAPRMLPQTRSLDPDAQPGERRLDVVLRRGATILGKVIDAETRDPIAGARVVLVAFEEWFGMSRHVGGTFMNPYGERVLAETTADEAGLFTIEHIPARNTYEKPEVASMSGGRERMLQLFALAPAYSSALGFANVEVEGATNEVTIEAWHAATITGRIVDREGHPVAGLRVTADAMPRQRIEARACVDDPTNAVVRSDVDGRYVLTGMPVRAHEGDIVQLGLGWDYRWKYAESATVEARAGESVVAPDIVATPQASIVVVVVDELGLPVVGARVYAKDEYRYQRTDERGRVRWFEPVMYLRKADGSGNWTDTLSFHVEKPGYARLLTETCKVTEDEPPPTLKVVMARGRTLRGRVTGPAGQPVARSGIYALPLDVPEKELERLRNGEWFSDANLQIAGTTSRDDGSFELAGLPALRMKLYVSVPIAWRKTRSLAPVVLEVEPGEGVAPLAIRLGDG